MSGEGNGTTEEGNDMSGSERPFANETIRYGYRATLSELAVIAVGARGVAAVLLGSDRIELNGRLREALRGADLVEDEEAIAPVLDAVARYLEKPTGEPGFDLDLRGDAGELAVWAALREIPMGETRSYGSLARAVGAGLTAQDVGAACAANRIAVVVPCHRVLKADGSISGYRWGVHRKRKLLAIEKAARPRTA